MRFEKPYFNKDKIIGAIVAVMLWIGLLILISYNPTVKALDDFDLAKYGNDDIIEVGRTDFIVKLIIYDDRDKLNKAFEKANGSALPSGAGIRGFANVNPVEDVCFVHIIPADIWDNREAMAIMGHEIYHCALADHHDVNKVDVIPNEPLEENKDPVDIEDLYAEDRRLELEWLKTDYEDMGIVIDK
jgi:hypothetical protein